MNTEGQRGTLEMDPSLSWFCILRQLQRHVQADATPLTGGEGALHLLLGQGPLGSRLSPDSLQVVKSALLEAGWG